MSSSEPVVHSSSLVGNRIAQTVWIDNVESKFREKETLRTTSFFCRNDPKPMAFTLKVKFQFGRKKLTTSLASTRTVTMSWSKVSLYDNEGKLVDSDVDEGFVLKEDYRRITELTVSQEVKEAATGDWRFICIFAYEASLPAEEVTSKDSVVSGLQEDLLKLLDTSMSADVTFIVEEEKIFAHKAILMARSEYFASMLMSNMVESVSNEIKVLDAEPVVFKGMLEFLYSGQAPKNLGDIAINLLALADKYGLDKLKKMCESKVRSNLKSQNVVDALLVAEKHNCPDLMSSAKEVFRLHCDTLKQSKDEREKLKTNPDLLLELALHYCMD